MPRGSRRDEPHDDQVALVDVGEIDRGHAAAVDLVRAREPGDVDLDGVDAARIERHRRDLDARAIGVHGDAH